MRDNPSKWRQEALRIVRESRAWAQANKPSPHCTNSEGERWAMGLKLAQSPDQIYTGIFPEPLFHATTSLKSIEASGVLRSRGELRRLSQQGNQKKREGLGGGPENTISLTPLQDGAMLIAAAYAAINEAYVNAWGVYEWFKEHWFPWAKQFGILPANIKQALRSTSESHRKMAWDMDQRKHVWVRRKGYGKNRDKWAEFNPGEMIREFTKMFATFGLGHTRNGRGPRQMDVPWIMGHNNERMDPDDIGYVRVYLNADFLAVPHDRGKFALISNVMPFLGQEDQMVYSQPGHLLGWGGGCLADHDEKWEAGEFLGSTPKSKAYIVSQRQKESQDRGWRSKKTFQFVAEGAIATAEGNKSEKNEFRVCPEDLVISEFIPLNEVSSWEDVLFPHMTPSDPSPPEWYAEIEEAEQELAEALAELGKL